jgi:hypothetical protein
MECLIVILPLIYTKTSSYALICFRGNLNYMLKYFQYDHISNSVYFLAQANFDMIYLLFTIL